MKASATRPLLATIFLSPGEPRLRSGWRLLIHGLLLVVVGVALALPLLGLQLVGAFPALDVGGTGFIVFMSGLQAVDIVLATWIARRWLDRRSFVSLGFQRSPQAGPDLLFGIGLGGLLMGLIVLLEWSLGWLDFEGFAWQAQPPAEVFAGLAFFAVVFLAVGFYEELLFRGYQLQNLAEGTNVPLALFVTSAAFGLLHLGNPNATWVSALGIFLAGYFLAYGWVRTRQLWIPIGLHVGWNFFQGPIFGFPVSGLETFQLLRHSVNGPALVTGGAFGPEAGLIVVPAMALGAFLIWLWTLKRIDSPALTTETRSH